MAAVLKGLSSRTSGRGDKVGAAMEQDVRRPGLEEKRLATPDDVVVDVVVDVVDVVVVDDEVVDVVVVDVVVVDDVDGVS